MVADTENSHKAQLYITKLAAAQHQLRAAVRMFFQSEDDLAIHREISGNSIFFVKIILSNI